MDDDIERINSLVAPDPRDVTVDLDIHDSIINQDTEDRDAEVGE